jgi:predicted alpha/beta superfamily hydrolase
MALTTILAEHPARLTLRGGTSPLSWDHSRAGTRDADGLWRFEFDAPEGDLIEFKLMKGKTWSRQRNYAVAGGQTARVGPYFDQAAGRMDGDIHTIEGPNRPVRFQVYLPPSYDEQPRRRYPVLYAHDGHVLFSTSHPDAFDGHTWRMDETLDFLWELGAMKQIIVVAVHSQYGRLDMLTPSVDDRFGGGGGPAHLAFLVHTLKPVIDERWRTRPERQWTAIMGASLGGLFAFWAAWTAPHTFGRAACLSPSFWWDGRSMVREVQRAQCPWPRPWLYLDSGAAIDPFEDDASLVDGFGHTSALSQALTQHCYAAGTDLHTLAFAGYRHDNASWAQRLATPLQLLFPRET